MNIMNLAIAKALITNRNLARYPQGPLSPVNPITPTFSGFDDSNPTNLSNITDGNRFNASGEGYKVMSGAGDIGTFIIDLGSINSNKNVLSHASVGLKVNTGSHTVTGVIEGSIDNSNWVNLSGRYALSATITNSYTYYDFSPQLLMGFRYVRLRLIAADAATYYAKCYEMTAFDMGV